MEKDSTDRSDADLQYLYHITKSVTFLVNQGAEVHLEACRYLKYANIRKGHVIFLQGDVGDFFCIVYEGAVAIDKTSNAGAKARICVIQPGVGFGELALKEEGTRSCSAYALEPTILFRLGKEHYTNFLDEHRRHAVSKRADYMARKGIVAHRVCTTVRASVYTRILYTHTPRRYSNEINCVARVSSARVGIYAKTSI